MKKKILLISLIFILLCTGSLFYLNSVFLPKKIKSLIVGNLQELTGKKVDLGSLQFSLFKGLVLGNLNIHEGERQLVNIKEASCTFLILPLLQKKIIIPKVRVKQAVILLVRKSDNRMDIPFLLLPAQTLPKAPVEKPKEGEVVAPSPLKAAVPSTKKFSVTINSIFIKDSRIDFQDETFNPVFIKSLENVNLFLKLSLPSRVNFSFKSRIRAEPVINISAAGEYEIAQQILAAKISLQDFSPREFSVYLKLFGIDSPQGITNTLVDLKSKEGKFIVEIESESKGLAIHKEKMFISLTSDTKAKLEYVLADQNLRFSGKTTISEANFKGLERIGDISGIKGELVFDNSGISADKLNASIMGAPVIAQFKLIDFQSPILDMNIAATLNLDIAQRILKDEFKFNLPVKLQGSASLVLGLNGKVPLDQDLKVSGHLDIINANVKPDRLASAIEDVGGRVEFSGDGLKWKGVNLKYLGIPYKTSGSLADFNSPKVNFALNAKDLALNSNFTVNKNTVFLAKLEGKYLNSDFFLNGDIDTSVPAKTQVNIKGELNLEASDLSKLLAKYKNQIEKSNPQGIVNAQFNLSGNINDFKSCILEAKISSEQFNAYGLKADKLFIDYNQANGLIDIPAIHLSLYEGTADIAAKVNLNSKNIPYWLTLDIRGVKLEKLKMDTGARQKDVAGILSSQVQINGFSQDISKLSGAGKILISEGRLWQLNLFKGLGSLMFARDFAKIVFNEGYCDFLIKDKQIVSETIALKSNIADIKGNAKIGFDGSLDATLNVKILDEFAPLSGTFKDLATTIMGQAGRFGIIKISGTIKEPKYKFKPAVGDIIKGLKDAIFGK